MFRRWSMLAYPMTICLPPFDRMEFMMKSSIRSFLLANALSAAMPALADGSIAVSSAVAKAQAFDAERHRSLPGRAIIK
jgi:hypothetical protein